MSPPSGTQRAVPLRHRIQLNWLNWLNWRLVSRYPLNGDQFYVNNNYFKMPTRRRHIRTSTRRNFLYNVTLKWKIQTKLATYFSHNSTSGYQPGYQFNIRLSIRLSIQHQAINQAINSTSGYQFNIRLSISYRMTEHFIILSL